MSFKRASVAVVVANRSRFLQACGLKVEAVVAGELVHGSKVQVVTSIDAGRGATDANWIEGVDGLVTSDLSLLLLTTHADCAPVVIYDSSHRVLGQAHAGWKGLRSGIIENLIDSVCSISGTKPGSLKAWIGPTIRRCCYPVGVEVARQFPAECSTLIGDTVALDLTRFIGLEFARLKMDPLSITDSGVCTACDPVFSSFRRDADKTVAMALVSGL